MPAHRAAGLPIDPHLRTAKPGQVDETLTLIFDDN